MGEHTSVIVVDDHALFRMGVLQALGLQKHFDVVGEGGSKDDALRLVEKLLPDVALLDISMPGNGIDAAREISARWPETKVVMLTVSEEDDDVLEALDAGAAGYVLKGAPAPDLIAAISTVADGQAYLSPALGMRLFGVIRNRTEGHRVERLVDKLSPKEAVVFRLLGRGFTNRMIAEEMGVQIKTVKFHVGRLLTKLGAKNRVEAALLAQRHLKPSASPRA
ncbi:MAG TPA: response regulator transcription factor [Ensifer sp.]|jgi:two-component system nitrate/nitrite response regulator NarL|uniref:response regulator transcription factor n=1 Tax=Ensifer sp. TaxID=1872086 RepID=UPI002E150DDB|nr:response regulator transcription factor [Ensifer sp.]